LKELVNKLLEYEVLYGCRLQSLLTLLEEYNISYKLDKSNGIRNVVIDVNVRKVGLMEIDGHVVLGAHYDAWPDSKGINDNYCAISALIKFIITAKERKVKEHIKVVFFDKEESGMLGSREYVRKYSNHIKYAFIFDIVGFGDRLVRCKSETEIDVDLSKHGVVNLNTNLPSDNLSFYLYYVPSVLIVSIPNDDIVIEGNDAKLIGNKFYEAFHNGIYDNDLNYITWSTVDDTYKLLCNVYF